MSIGLTLKIWHDDKKNKRIRLLELLEAVNRHGGQETCNGLTVRNSDLTKKKLELYKPLSFEMISEILREYEESNVYISVHSAIPCWRFDGMTPKEGFVPILINIWSEEFFNDYGRRREMEGDAEITFDTVGPFTALIKNEEDSQVQLVNNHVEENLERVTNIIFEISNQVKPSVMKVFTDRGLYQPLNAHLIFYREPNVLINDLVFLKELWTDGLPAYNTPPLKNSLEEFDQAALQPLRSEELSHSICVQLSELIENIKYLTEKDIGKINWELYDNYEGENGRIVLDYPHFVNCFLDNFYLDLLKIPSKTS